MAMEPDGLIVRTLNYNLIDSRHRQTFPLRRAYRTTARLKMGAAGRLPKASFARLAWQGSRLLNASSGTTRYTMQPAPVLSAAAWLISKTKFRIYKQRWRWRTTLTLEAFIDVSNAIRPSRLCVKVQTYKLRASNNASKYSCDLSLQTKVLSSAVVFERLYVANLSCHILKWGSMSIDKGGNGRLHTKSTITFSVNRLGNFIKNHLTKEAQKFGDFLGKFGKHLFSRKSCCGSFRATFVIIFGLFNSSILDTLSAL